MLNSYQLKKGQIYKEIKLFVNLPEGQEKLLANFMNYIEKL